MKKQLADLAIRRRVLLEKIEFQRMEVAEISLLWQKPLVLVDAGLKTVRFMRNHPALLTGCVAALLALRRKGIIGLAHEARRLLYLYPFKSSFGLKRFSLTTHSPSEGRHIDPDR